jgi:hypothetical protein
MNEAWHLLKECDHRCVPAAAIPTTSQPTTTSTEDRARINFSLGLAFMVGFGLLFEFEKWGAE